MPESPTTAKQTQSQKIDEILARLDQIEPTIQRIAELLDSWEPIITSYARALQAGNTFQLGRAMRRVRKDHTNGD